MPSLLFHSLLRYFTPILLWDAEGLPFNDIKLFHLIIFLVLGQMLPLFCLQAPFPPPTSEAVGLHLHIPLLYFMVLLPIYMLMMPNLHLPLSCLPCPEQNKISPYPLYTLYPQGEKYETLSSFQSPKKENRVLLQFPYHYPVNLISSLSNMFFLLFSQFRY